MNVANTNAQLKKIHGVATWLEKAWLAVNEPESGVVAVDVRALVPHLKGLKRDAIPELVAAARDLGDEATKNALLDGAVLNTALDQKIAQGTSTNDDIVAPQQFKGKSILKPLFEHGDPVLWRGDKQPVPDETIVHIVTMDGVFYANFPAKHFDWGRRDDGREILAFVVDRDPHKHLRLAALAGKRVEFKDPSGFWRESGFMHFPDKFVTSHRADDFRIVETASMDDEHRRLSLSLLSRHGEAILWAPAEQPVSDDTPVDVVTNNGQFFPGFKACHFDWEKTGPYGIHAYIVRRRTEEGAPAHEAAVSVRIPAFLLKPAAKAAVEPKMSDKDLAAIYGMSVHKMRGLREALATRNKTGSPWLEFPGAPGLMLNPAAGTIKIRRQGRGGQRG